MVKGGWWGSAGFSAKDEKYSMDQHLHLLTTVPIDCRQGGILQAGPHPQFIRPTTKRLAHAQPTGPSFGNSLMLCLRITALPPALPVMVTTPVVVFPFLLITYRVRVA